MKKTDKISYRQKSREELIKLSTDLQKKIVESQSQLSTGQLKDTSIFKKLKYEVSLINTILHDQK